MQESAPLTPKVIPTVSIPATALALAPEDRTVGFATATEPWNGAGAFASAEQPTALPQGVRIARFDEINEIDLAADAKTEAAAPSDKSDRLAGVSLVTPANAASPPKPSTAASSSEGAARRPETTSWLSWLYGKLVDGALTGVLAIRSIFV